MEIIIIVLTLIYITCIEYRECVYVYTILPPTGNCSLVRQSSQTSSFLWQWSLQSNNALKQLEPNLSMWPTPLCVQCWKTYVRPSRSAFRDGERLLAFTTGMDIQCNPGPLNYSQKQNYKADKKCYAYYSVHFATVDKSTGRNSSQAN